MVLGKLTQLMANLRLVAVAASVAALLYWQREAVLDQLQEQFRWVAIFAAGGFLGWSYYGKLTALMEVIPL